MAPARAIVEAVARAMNVACTKGKGEGPPLAEAPPVVRIITPLIHLRQLVLECHDLLAKRKELIFQRSCRIG